MGPSNPSGRDVLRQSVRGQRRDVALGALLGSGHQAGEALVPVLIGVVIDRAVTDSDTGALLLWLGVLAVVHTGLALSYRYGAWSADRAAAQAEHDLRITLVRRVLHPRGGAEEGRLPGALANVATEDAKRVGAVNLALMAGISALVGILACAVVLLRASVTLGLVVLLGTPVLLWLGHLLGKPLQARSEAEQERAAHASAVAADLVAGLRILKGIGGEPTAIARYRTTSRDSLQATLKAARAQAFQSGMVLTLTGCLIAAVTLVGGRLAANGDISLGQLVSAVGLALFLLGPLEVLAWVNAELAQGRASASRIADVLAAPHTVDAGERTLPQPVRGAVRLSGVSLGGLHDVHLTLATGERVALVGASGASKTTLAKLIAGVHRTLRLAVASVVRHPHTRRRAPHAPSPHRHTPEGPLMLRSLRGTRFAAGLASALLLFVTVSACGSDDDSDTAGSAATESSSTAFPVTLPHTYGSTTIESEPKRIVTVGLTDQDAVLALGKVPVGTTEWLGGYEGAIGPWAEDELGGAAAPTVLKDTGTGPQTEKIAALDPDLILAVYGGLTKEQYDTLSKFAPVVAQPEEYNDFGVPWQDQTEIIGKALGQEAEAKELVAGVEADFKQAADEHPEFAGSSAVMATPYEGIFVFGSQDPRSRLLTNLGFSLPKDLDKVIGDEFGANISKERTDLLDTDAIVWIVSDPAKDKAELRKDSLYADLTVAKDEREVFVKETSDYGNAVSFVSVLSLPYTLERLVPQLAAAVDGDTATKVTEPTS